MKCIHTGHTPGRPPVITDTPWLIEEPNTEGLWLTVELSVGPIVPKKTTCDTRGRGDTDRTGTKGQQWAYCPERAWYNPTANGTRLRQQRSFSSTLSSCVQLLDGGVAEQ